MTQPAPDLQSLEKLATAHAAIREQIAKAVVGQDDVVEQLLVSIFARGHCMLEGVPGLAKTLMVSTLAKSMSLDFARIQFTPDLMPSDITGTEVMFENKETGNREFKFVHGPVFTHILLADEINRTPPKTQAALLEGMQERQVSSGGKRYPLPDPFFVLATQNPIEQEGTYPLPEAQLDRFFMKVFVDYPSADEERRIYRLMTGGTPQEPSPVLAAAEVIELQQVVRKVPISDLLLDYVMRLIRATRVRGESGNGSGVQTPGFVKQWVLWGAGPRGGQSLIMAAKARAALRGNPEVEAQDIRAMAAAVLRHRIVLNYNAEAEGQTSDTLIAKLLDTIPLSDQHPSETRVDRVLK